MGVEWLKSDEVMSLTNSKIKIHLIEINYMSHYRAEYIFLKFTLVELKFCFFQYTERLFNCIVSRRERLDQT